MQFREGGWSSCRGRLMNPAGTAELRSAGQPGAAVPTWCNTEPSWNYPQWFGRKTKRPRLNLSLGTSVDQPSPKCCSRTTLTLGPDSWNGSRVLRHGTNGEPGNLFCAQNKTPQTQLSLGTSVDQPSPKCCSRTTLVLTLNPVNGSPVLYMARKWWVAGNGQKRPKRRGENRVIHCKFTNCFPRP